MAYLSCDASIKVSKNGRWHSTKSGRSGVGGVQGLANHLARKECLQDGVELRHENENIDPELTEENDSYFLDTDGKYKKCRHASDLVNAVENRIKFVQEHSTKPIKDDAVILRPIVTQLDIGTDDKAEEKKLFQAELDFMKERFGKDNVVGFSVHRDETSTHVHWLVTPVAYQTHKVCYKKEPVMDKETGKQKRNAKNKLVYKRFYKIDEVTNELCFDQKQFFSTPAELRELHKSFRQHLVDRGYDVELENKSIDEQEAYSIDSHGNTHIKSISKNDRKAIDAMKADAKTARTEATELLASVQVQKESVEQQDMNVSLREIDLDTREADLHTREEALQADRALLQKNMDEFTAQKEKWLKSANNALQEAIPADVDDVLSYADFKKVRIPVRMLGNTATTNLVPFREAYMSYKRQMLHQELKQRGLFQDASQQDTIATEYNDDFTL